MSKLLYTDKPIFGLDISHTGIKAMAIDPKKWSVEGYGSIDLEPLRVKEALEVAGKSYLTDNIKLLLSEKTIGSISTNRVAIAVPTARSFSRTFVLPSSAEKNLQDAVMLEAEQYIPIPTDNLYIDYEIIERSKKEITVLMSAVTKMIIDNVVASVEAAGLQPVLIEPGICSVGRVLTATERGNLPTVIVDIGPANTDIAILDRGSIRVTGGLAVGGNTFTLDIAKKLNVALENAHQLKVLNGLNAGPRQQKLSAALEPSLQRVLAEVKKVIRYYDERVSNGRKLEQLLVVGSGSNLPGIGEYFTNALVMPARVASPWQKLDFAKIQEPPKQFRPRYITVAGVASIPPGGIWK
ncbi:pilus assembly protein PilM [Candidatus Saccharibacteria bacterium]|nr:pilus assembly protein PilM [Candidatus Saccharibacteria bacterium]MBJ58415.1 pilus assembly protein PilM [Candidatus Saccharibacteria bacterium]MBQ69269.1 pilus assembly protein PilM [Candidatus Saccharibacteria bacterium]|tara:strand:- start:696 stop:1754 length:1059 start_codon:yes stop_codon:yes gene_type:complete